MKSTYLHPSQRFATLPEPPARRLPVRAVAPQRRRPADPVRVGASALSLLDRLDQWVWRSRQRDLERSLESAADLVDLERRLKDGERSAFHRYY